MRLLDSVIRGDFETGRLIIENKEQKDIRRPELENVLDPILTPKGLAKIEDPTWPYPCVIQVHSPETIGGSHLNSCGSSLVVRQTPAQIVV